MPHAKPCRPFTIADGMILVAATAGGFALLRWYIEAIEATRGGLGRISFRALGAACPVIAWTLALAALALRRPRPSIRRLAGRAGPGAVLAIGLVSLLIMPPYIVARITWQQRFTISPGFDFVFVLAHMGGSIALGHWLLLLVARRFRAGRGWIDRSTLLVSALWVVLLVGLLVARVLGNP